MTKHGIEPLPSGHEIMEHIVTSVIGAGGFGIVYLAEHPKLHIRAAVKEFAPVKLAHRDANGALVPLEGKEDLFNQILDRFDKTAAQLCALDHPNIVKVYNQRSDNNTSYVLMEFVTGQTFGQWVQNQIDELDHARFKELLLPLLEAIEYLHDRHLMHRDIAPDNILMRQDGVPILIDFGTLKQHVLGEETNLEVTEEEDPSVVVAKKFFSPPEQFSAYRKSELGLTADIYSLGATIYDALAGRADDMTRHLVPATDRASNVVAPGGRHMPPLREVARISLPQSFCDAVDAALSLSPRNRPKNIAEFRDMLFPGEAEAKPVVQQPPVTQPTSLSLSQSSPPPVRQPPSDARGEVGIRWGRLAGLVTGALAAAGAGVFLILPVWDTNGGTTPPSPPQITESPSLPIAGSPSSPMLDSPSLQIVDTASLTIVDSPSLPIMDSPSPQIAQSPTPLIADSLSSQIAESPSPPIVDLPSSPIQPSSPPEFRLDLARSVSGLSASGTVPPAFGTALEAIFGTEDLSPGLEVFEGISVPDDLDLIRLAQIVQSWGNFSFSAGPNSARLQGEPVNAQSYFQALDVAGDAVELDLSFLTSTLPRDDVLALIDYHDPCGTLIPLDLGNQLAPTDQLTLFGHVASVQSGINLRRGLVLLLPGTLNGDALVPTSQAMCDVAREFRNFVGRSPRQIDSLFLSMGGTRAELGQTVSHMQSPQFAVAREALPASGYLWTGLVMRGPGGSLLMLPLSQPSGDVEDLSGLARGAGAPDYIALTRPPEATPNLDLTFAPELALTFDPSDTYATLLGLVLDREISGLPTLGATAAPEAGEYLDVLQQAVERSGATVLSYFQQPIAVD